MAMYDLDEAHKYYGKYRGFVRDRMDPEKRCRVRIFCPSVMGPSDDPDHWLDWADACLPDGGLFDQGDAVVPGDGAGVWVEFEMGDVEHPIWTGCWVGGSTSSTSDTPQLAKGTGDASTQAPKGTAKAQTKTIDEESGAPVDGELFQEALSPFAGQYPNVRVIKTASGHVIEFDDTDGEERIHIYHRSGSYYEVNSSGGLTHKQVGNRHDIVKGRHIEHDNEKVLVVDGPMGETLGGLVSQVYLDGIRRHVAKEVFEWYRSTITQNIVGDLIRSIGGSLKNSIQGNYGLSVVGNYTKFVNGAMDITTLEKIAFTLGNSSTSADAWLVTALTGDISFLAQTGLFNAQGIMGVEIDGGAVGVKIGSSASEPLLKGTSLQTALNNFANNLVLLFTSGNLVGNMGAPVPTLPLVATLTPYVAQFATEIAAALSPLNKVA